MSQSLAIPRVIPNDWKRLGLIVNKIKFRLGSASSPTFTGITVTGLAASTLIGVNASKALESVTIGTGLDYTRPTLSLSHLGIEALTDPGVDKILFWDDSATACKWLGMGNSVAITATTLDAIQDIRTTASPEFAGVTITNCCVLGSNSAVFQPNADAVTFFQVLDADGGTPVLNVDTVSERVGVGTVAPSLKFDVKGSPNTTFTNCPLLMQVHTIDAFADGMGGGISLGGRYDATHTTTFGYIAGLKDGAGDSDTAGKLILGARPTGGGGVDMTAVTILGTGALTGKSTATFEGASVTVGKASTTTGTVVLHDSNSANTITLTVPNISAGSLSFTLPPTDGANTNVLQTDGNGVLTWVAAGGGLDINGLDAITDVDTAADYYPVYDASAAANKKVLVPFCAEKTTRTVNLNSGMSQATLQATIDAVGKYIDYGVTLTFQFADGTYALTDTLWFRGFFGPGTLQLFGNQGEANATALHTTQAVYIDGDGFNDPTIAIQNTAVLRINAYNLKVSAKTDTWDYDTCIHFLSNTGQLYVRYSYLLGTGTTQGCGVYFGISTYGQPYKCYVSNMKFGIIAMHGSIIGSSTNDDTGTPPAYGIAARFGALLHKTSTQPAGSTANEYSDNGGEIR